MKKNYTKLLATKLREDTYEELIKLAREDKRTLSGISRLIIEKYH